MLWIKPQVTHKSQHGIHVFQMEQKLFRESLAMKLASNFHAILSNPALYVDIDLEIDSQASFIQRTVLCRGSFFSGASVMNSSMRLSFAYSKYTLCSVAD